MNIPAGPADRAQIPPGKPKLAEGARMRYDPARQRIVLLLPERAVFLNETAAEILGLCDGTRTVPELVAELKRRYPHAEVEADVLELIETAAARRWIQWAGR